MKIVIQDVFNNTKDYQSGVSPIPEIGDRIDMGYRPLSKVIERIWLDNFETVILKVE